MPLFSLKKTERPQKRFIAFSSSSNCIIEKIKIKTRLKNIFCLKHDDRSYLFKGDICFRCFHSLAARRPAVTACATGTLSTLTSYNTQQE